MHPMRVEWSQPDHTKRLAAQEKVAKDIERMRSRGMGLDAGVAGLERSLMLALTEADKAEIWVRRYPDLNAEIIHYGTLLSVRYVAEQHGVTYDQATKRVIKHELCKSKWVALVATEHDTKEMDPTTFRVIWPMSAGDPIGGVVGPDELQRRAGVYTPSELQRRYERGKP